MKKLKKASSTASKKYMNCPKCKGQLHESINKVGASYRWCSLCKGLWLSSQSLLKIFKNHDFVRNFLKVGLDKPMETIFNCPSCDEKLFHGKVGASELMIDECLVCKSYFFDEKEINTFFELLSSVDMPVASGVNFDSEKLTKSDINCPVCVDTSLYTVNSHEDDFLYCLSCEGFETSIAKLNLLGEKSFFGPTMFTFRDEQGVISICRRCGVEQNPKNSNCQDCGCEMRRINCQHCQGRMSEYELNGIVIERCQMCSKVWLDTGEFEKIMVSMPDLRKQYEAGKLQNQLKRAAMEGASHAYAVSIERSRRQMINNFWGRWGIISWLLYK